MYVPRGTWDGACSVNKGKGLIDAEFRQAYMKGQRLPLGHGYNTTET